MLSEIAYALEAFDELVAQPAVYGHPLKREIEVPAAGVVLVVFVAQNPIRILKLLSIDEL